MNDDGDLRAWVELGEDDRFEGVSNDLLLLDDSAVTLLSLLALTATKWGILNTANNITLRM